MYLFLRFCNIFGVSIKLTTRPFQLSKQIICNVCVVMCDGATSKKQDRLWFDSVPKCSVSRPTTHRVSKDNTKLSLQKKKIYWTFWNSPHQCTCLNLSIAPKPKLSVVENSEIATSIWTHRSTNQAWKCLTSLSRRENVAAGKQGHRWGEW